MQKEFEDLSRKFTILEMNIADKNTNLLQRFDERFIFEVTRKPATKAIFYNLWIENENRHNFRKEDWVKSYQRFQKFVLK